MRRLLSLLGVVAVVAAVVWRLGAERRDGGPASRALAAEGATAGQASIGLGEVELVAPPEPMREPVHEPIAAAPAAFAPVVSGRVEVAGGLPLIDEVVVTATLSRGSSRLQRLETRVGLDGAFAFELPKGADGVALDVESRLLLLSEEVLACAGATDVVLRPRPRAAVRGRVHWPLRTPRRADAPVVRVAAGSESSVEVGGDRAFELLLEPGAAVELIATSAGIAGDPTHPPLSGRLALEPLRPLETRIVDLWLRRAGIPLGTVVDRWGEPVEGAWVSVARVEGDSMRIAAGEPERLVASEKTSMTTTDEAGAFTLSALGPGTWRLSASADGYRAGEQVISVGEEELAPVRLVLEPAAVLRGFVVDADGVPCAGAEVREIGADQLPFTLPKSLRIQIDIQGQGEPISALLQGRATRTDVQGAFELGARRLPARLRATASGHAPSEELAVSSAFDSVVLVLRRECRVRGRALDASGNPIPALLTCLSGGIEVPVVASEGVFQLSGLPPGRARFVTRVQPENVLLEVELRPEEEAVVELVVPAGEDGS